MVSKNNGFHLWKREWMNMRWWIVLFLFGLCDLLLIAIIALCLRLWCLRAIRIAKTGILIFRLFLWWFENLKDEREIMKFSLDFQINKISSLEMNTLANRQRTSCRQHYQIHRNNLVPRTTWPTVASQKTRNHPRPLDELDISDPNRDDSKTLIQYQHQM